MPFEPIPRWIPDEDGHTGALYNNFSVYVLRQQWPSEWCCREQTHGWCLDILSAPYRERMVLHGLWPSMMICSILHVLTVIGRSFVETFV